MAAVSHNTGLGTARRDGHTVRVHNGPRVLGLVQAIAVVHHVQALRQVQAQVEGHFVRVDIPHICGGAIAKGVREAELLVTDGEGVGVPSVAVTVVHEQRRTRTSEDARTVVDGGVHVVVARGLIGATCARGVVSTTHAAVVVHRTRTVVGGGVRVVVARLRVGATCAASKFARAVVGRRFRIVVASRRVGATEARAEADVHRLA